MNVLVIGSGGREHALAWRLARSASVKGVFATPGNPGIAQVATCVPSQPNVRDYLRVAEETHADLTVVGPEVPLVEGVVDAFRAAGRHIVGPDRRAAQLEGSKIFAKNFLEQREIPTARFRTVENASAARDALRNFTYPVVLKADGLAAGKGVVIAKTSAEADAALASLPQGRLVIEEFLEGEEVSFIVLSDGRDVLPLEPTQDHKPVFDGDTGPNTGGMGAYSDAQILNPRQRTDILDTIIRPTIEATGFTGFLYAGLMMTGDGPKVLEFNVRLGDPETQPLMLRLDCDLGTVLMAAAEGWLARTEINWNPNPAVCVVLASGGYPGAYETGKPLQGIEAAESAGATVFHAGTRTGRNGLETSGGRVLGVTASGPDLASAIARTYDAAGRISFEGMHYRTDIGRQGLKRYNKSSLGT